MAWITSANVEAILQTDLSVDTWIDGLIDHCQALAEAIIGEQDTPNSATKAVLSQIVARMWRGGKQASSNPEGFQSASIAEEFSYTVPTGAHIDAGLGLTNREKKELRRAAGKQPVWFITQTNEDSMVFGSPHETEEAWLDGAL